MLRSALWGILSLLLTVSIGCGEGSIVSTEPSDGRALAEATPASPTKQTATEDATSLVEDQPVGIQPAFTVLPASVEWPVPDSDDGPASAAVDDGPVAKTIHIDITWDENYNYIFDFDGPLTVPAGKKVRFIVTNTFTNPDECW